MKNNRIPPKIINPWQNNNPNKSPSTLEKNKTYRILNQQEITSRKQQKIIPSSIFEFRMKLESFFEEMMKRTFEIPINEAIESTLIQVFVVEKCIFWIYNKNDNNLFSPTYNIIAHQKNSLVWFVFKTQSILQIQKQSDSYQNFFIDPNLAHPDSPQLFLPITTQKNALGIIQLIRNPNSNGFNQNDLDISSFFLKKFRIYGNSLFNLLNPLNIAYQISEKNVKINELILNFFNCKFFEFYMYDIISDSYNYYDFNQNLLILTNIEENCLLKHSILNKLIINEKNTELNEYSNEYDKSFNGSVLLLPISLNKRETWCFILRGGNNPFGSIEESILKSLSIFIINSIMDKKSIKEGEILVEKLIELIELIQKLKNKIILEEVLILLENISIKLFDCESCNISILNNKSNIIKNSKGEKFLLTSGLSGKLISNYEILFITNFKPNEFFDSKLDCPNVKNPFSCLGSSIIKNNNEIIGSILLWNKKGNDSFLEDDKTILNYFLSLINIVISNCIFYKLLIQLFKKSLIFLRNSQLSNSSYSTKQYLDTLLNNLLKLFNFQRITLFFSERDSNHLFSSFEVGNSFDFSTTFSDQVVIQKKKLIFNSDQIKEKMNEFDSSLFLIDNSFSKSNLYCIPIFNNSNICVGVLEIYGIFQYNINFFETFSLIISKSLNSLSYQEMASYGYSKLDITSWIIEEEYRLFTIPSMFLLKDNIKKDLLIPGYDFYYLNGINSFKIIFFLFDKFSFLSHFNISNEKFFNFLSEISRNYLDHPSFSWMNTIGILQTITSIIFSFKLEKIFSKLECFSLILSGLIIYLNPINIKELSQNPTEIFIETLSSKQSYEESQSLLKSIIFLTSDKTNIFNNISSAVNKNIWNLIVELVLITNPNNFFPFLDEISSFIQTNDLDFEESQSHKILLMKLILICSIYSDLCRSYDLFLNVFDFIGDSFLRKGDISRIQGIVYIGNNKNRQFIDKKETLFSFYSSLITNIYSFSSKLLPSNKLLLNNLINNLSNYKKENKKWF